MISVNDVRRIDGAFRYHDWTYLQMLQNILKTGCYKPDRTGTGTISTFAQQMRFDLSGNSLPLLTTKKMFHRGITHELIWFLSGSTNVKPLQDNNVHIWDEWADKNGELGPVYGEMWRAWPCVDGEPIDQIAEVIHQLRTNPHNRRIIVSAWNPELVDKQALPPCHALFQFWVDMDGGLSCHLYQRSCDSFLGVPFNIAQYSMLTHMIAQVSGLTAKEFIWTGGDVHIYKNHIDQITTQLNRDAFPSPLLKLNPDIKNIDAFTFDDIEVVAYDDYHPAIVGEVST